MIKRLMVVSCMLLFGTVSQAGELRSGLQPGDRTSAFYVDDVTGPRRGNSLCYVCAFGNHSVINIQMRSLNDHLLTLLQTLDPLVAPAERINGTSQHAFVVYLTDDPEGAASELKAVADRLNLKNIPLTIYDEPTGPDRYGIADQAEVTVMMWKDATVTVNHAFAAGELNRDSLAAVMTAIDRHLGR